MKKVLLIATGGTIACSATENGLAPTADAEKLLSFIPEYKQICEVEYIAPFCIDSTNVNAFHWLQIARLIKENYDLYDGFLITHGTDTLAFTSCALSCLIENSHKPIVLTGSQKPVEDVNTDAKGNLLQALKFAVSGYNGVMVVFAGKIIDGMCAKKVRTVRNDAFESINYPEITENKLNYAKTVFYDKLETNVMCIKLTPNMPKAVFECGKKCKGVVIEGYGLGGIPDVYVENIKELSDKGIIVAVTTQAVYDGCDLSVYEVGSHIKEIENVIETGLMTCEAVTVKLMWALAQTNDIEKIKQFF